MTWSNIELVQERLPQSNPRNLCWFIYCGFSRTKPQCIDWHLFFFIPYGASCFSVLVLVSIIDSARVVLPALLGLYKVWVLQFWGRAHDFHTQIWPHTEFGNCLVTKSPDWRLSLLLFKLNHFMGVQVA